MWTRTRWICGLCLFLAAEVCPAQPAHGQKADQTKPIEAEPPAAAGEAIPQGMARYLTAMTKELSLDAAQQEAVRDLVSKHEAEMSQLREEMKVPADLREKLNSLAKEMAEARHAGDQARAQELMAARTELVKVAMETRAPVEEKMRGLREELRQKLQEVLRPDQQQQFETFWGTVMVRDSRARRAPDRSPRALKVILDRMEDLTYEQKTYIDTLFAAYRDASRNDPQQAAGQQEGREQQAQIKKLYDEVFEVLTDSQKERVERSLRSRRDNADRDKVREVNGGKNPEEVGKEGKATGEEKEPERP